jgi:Mlc titration factor MtfA (ptsG expression regulator)
MTLFLIAAAALAAVAALIAPAWLGRHRRAALRALPFPPQWRRILARRVPYYRRLPMDLRRQLEAQVRVFLGEKSFVGCAGQAIDDEVRVTIAAQACLLVLNRRDYCYPNLREVLVYPSAFAVQRVRGEPSGVLQEQRQVLSGESWTRGQVILSWEDALHGAAIDDDGRNVVIHEFAHQLDQEKGHANGAPWLGSRHRYPRWSQVLGAEFARLQHDATTGQPSLLDHYGARDPAEFFAVASEVFFEQPRSMAALHPALYEELRHAYRVDPARFPVD